MLGEFSEEYLQEILDPVFRHITLKTEEEMNLLSPDVLYAGFLGALFGTGVESVDAVVNGLSAESTAMDSSTKDSDYAEFADILSEPEDLENFKYLASLPKAEQEAFIASLTVDALEEGKPATALEDVEFADILSEPEDLEKFKYLASLDKAEQEAFIETLFDEEPVEAETPVTTEEIINLETEISQTEDLPVEETAERGIINNEELYRKAPNSREGFKFISKERFDSLTVEARKNGATIVRGTPEVEKHLIDMGASASHLGGALLFMRDVCVSDVLEETYHHMQNLRGLNDDKESTLRTILNEIDAKQYLLDNAQKYQIPRNEIELTRKQLEGYKKQLEEYGGK